MKKEQVRQTARALWPVTAREADAMDCTTDYCSRGPDGCGGALFTRTSRSGLTVATICARHADELERALDKVAERYPEVYHSDGCGCWGCSEGPTDPAGRCTPPGGLH